MRIGKPTMQYHSDNNQHTNLRISLYSLVISSQSIFACINKQETLFLPVFGSNSGRAFDLWFLIYWAHGVTSPRDVVD